MYYSAFFFFVWTTPRRAKRENAAWGACTFVTMLEMWFLLGAYNWGQVLFGLPRPPGPPSLLVGVLLVVLNYRVLVDGAWTKWHTRFQESSPRQRRTMLVVGGAATAVAWVLMATSYGALHAM